LRPHFEKPNVTREAAQAQIEAAMAEARRHLISSRFSLQRMKALVSRGMERDLCERMPAQAKAMAACFKSNDRREGAAWLLEKRPAKSAGA